MFTFTRFLMFTATLPRNRLTPFFNAPPPLPADAATRKTALADAVFAALRALQAQLTHHDPQVVLNAATMILDLEKTRLRHARSVVGTTEPLESSSPPSTDWDQCHIDQEEDKEEARMEEEDLWGGERNDPWDRSNPLEQHVETLRQYFQMAEDLHHTGRVVHRDKLRKLVRAKLEEERQRREQAPTAAATTPPASHGVGIPSGS
jgi:hypothetical protein